MKRWQQAILGLIAVLVVGLGVGVTWLYVSFDPGAYRGRIEALATEAVGREVRIQGPIRLSLLPFPAVVLKSIEIGNPDPIGRDRLAEVDRVSISPRPLDLLAGRLAVGTVAIDGLRMVLARGANGQTNWDGIVDAIAAGPGQALGAPRSQQRLAPRPTNLPLDSLAVSAVDIHDARIRFIDEKRGQSWLWDNGRLQTGRMTDGAPFRLELTGVLARADQAVRSEVYVMTRIEPHLADRFYRFSDLSLNLLIDGEQVPGGMQEINISANGDMDFSAGRYSLSDFLMQSGGLAVAGKIDGAEREGQTFYNGRLTVRPFSPRSVLQQLRIAPPRIRDKAALGRAGFDAQFEGDADHVAFKQIAAQLDQSHLTGTAAVQDFADPHLSFDLVLDQLDVDRYLAPADIDRSRAARADSVPEPADDDAEKTADETGRPTFAGLWPTIDHGGFDGRLRVGALDAAGLHLADAETRVAGGPDTARLDSLTAAAYDGRLQAQGAIERRPDGLRYELMAEMRHIALGRLIFDLTGDQRISGLADIDVELNAMDNRNTTPAASLNGRLTATLSDARLAGYDLNVAIARQTAGQANTTSTPVTPVDALATTLVIDDGMARTTRMAWQNARYQAEGDGQYDLAEDALDYRFELIPRDETTEQPPMRLQLTGSIARPDVALSAIETPAEPEAESEAPADETDDADDSAS